MYVVIVVVFLLCYCFFFSSRRRHTRCSRDWSSDVCSSDLLGRSVEQPFARYGEERLLYRPPERARPAHMTQAEAAQRGIRSEERRVGKEGRDRGGREDEKKNKKNRIGRSRMTNDDVKQ